MVGRPAREPVHLVVELDRAALREAAQGIEDHGVGPRGPDEPTARTADHQVARREAPAAQGADLERITLHHLAGEVVARGDEEAVAVAARRHRHLEQSGQVRRAAQRRPCGEHPHRVELRHQAVRDVGHEEPKPQRVEYAGRPGLRGDPLRRNGEDHVQHLPTGGIRARTDDEVGGHEVERHVEALAVAIGGRPHLDRMVAEGALVGEPHAARRPLVDGIEVGARVPQLERQGVEPAPLCWPKPRLEPERVERALDQLEVLHVPARHEVEDQVAVGAAVQPALVRLEAASQHRARAGVLGAAVRIAMTDVDDPAIIELRLGRTVALRDVVVSMAAHQPEVAPCVEPAPVVLGEPLPGLARFGDVTSDPETLEPRRAGRRRRERVERGELRRGRQVAQLRAVQAQRRGRRRRPRAGAIGSRPLPGPPREVRRARELEEAHARVPAHGEIGLERRDGRIRFPDLALHPAAGELHVGDSPRRRGRGQAHGLERHLQARLDPLLQRRVGEVDAGLREAGVGLGRARERAGRLGEVVLAQLLPEVLDRDDRVLALRELGEAEAVPRVRPIRLQLPRPLELARGVVVVRLRAGELPRPIGDEPQAQVDEGVVPVTLGDLDGRGLEPAQCGGVRDAGERIAQPLQGRAVGGVLRGQRERHGPGSVQQRERKEETAQAGGKDHSQCNYARSCRRGSALCHPGGAKSPIPPRRTPAAAAVRPPAGRRAAGPGRGAGQAAGRSSP